MLMPPPAHRSEPSLAEVPNNPSQFVVPQFSGQGSKNSIGGNAPRGVDSLCHQFLHPAALVARLPQGPFVDRCKIAMAGRRPAEAD